MDSWKSTKAKWWIANDQEVIAPKDAKEDGIYVKQPSVKGLSWKQHISYFTSQYSFLGVDQIGPTQYGVAAIAVEAKGTVPFFGSMGPFFHGQQDKFPGIIEYHGKYYLSFLDYRNKDIGPKPLYPLHVTFYRRRLPRDKWYLQEQAPFIVSKTPSILHVAFKGVGDIVGLYHVYELERMMPPNIVGPNEVFRRGYTEKPTGNAMTCATLNYNKTGIPIYPNVDNHIVSDRNCDDFTVLGANDCMCGTAFDDFYNGSDMPWFENLIVNKTQISAQNWVNYCNNEYRASFVDGWISLNGKSPVVQSAINGDVASVTIEGLYYCPLTIWGYPVDLSSVSKWDDVKARRRTVNVLLSQPFFTSTGAKGSPKFADNKYGDPFPQIEGRPSAPQMWPNYMWNKTVTIKACSQKHIDVYYDKYLKQFIEPFHKDDPAGYDLYVKTYSKVKWRTDIETQLTFNNIVEPGFNPLNEAEIHLFYKYFCNECVAWVWFLQGWPGNWDKTKVQPNCAKTHQVAQINPWLFTDTEVLMGIAAIEVGVAYYLRNDPMVVAIVPTSAVLMFGASMVWANRSDNLKNMVDSLDDIWVDLKRLFYDVEDYGHEAKKAGERAEEGILVAAVGVLTTGSVMMLTYRELGDAGAELLATEFMIGVVGTLAVEAYIAIARDVTSFWDNLFGKKKK